MYSSQPESEKSLSLGPRMSRATINVSPSSSLNFAGTNILFLLSTVCSNSPVNLRVSPFTSVDRSFGGQVQHFRGKLHHFPPHRCIYYNITTSNNQEDFKNFFKFRSVFPIFFYFEPHLPPVFNHFLSIRVTIYNLFQVITFISNSKNRQIYTNPYCTHLENNLLSKDRRDTSQ